MQAADDERDKDADNHGEQGQWRDIAHALDPPPFDPSNPERHASRAYREGLDWAHMKRSVLTQKHSGILHRSPRRGGNGWTIRDHRAILHSEPYASADLGAASDVTTKAMWSEAASVSPSTAISPQLPSAVIAPTHRAAIS